MVSSTSAADALAPLTRIRMRAPSTADSTRSFTQQITSALEDNLGSDLKASHARVDIQPAEGQTSVDSQFFVRIKDPEKPAVTTVGASSTTSTAAASSAAGASAAIHPSGPVATNELDAYWALQPLPVQALRNVQDEGERTLQAQHLADQGYTIDVPIMVWRWDPLITMTIRQNSGYTWVPSGNQTPLPSCPNCDMPGIPAYDPKHPPVGSILVSTDFAKGLESTAPWRMG